jgi:hypothetical protein
MEALVTYLESADDAAQARAVSLLQPLLEREGSTVLGAHAATLLSAPGRPAFALVAMLDNAAVNANVGTLLQLLAHDTEAVRSTAARACHGKIHGVAAKEHFKTLRVLLTNESETVRSAVESICHTIEVSARKALAKTLVAMLSQSAAERSMAEKLLSRLDGDMELDVATDLLRLLEHPDDAIRHSAAKLANGLRRASLSGAVESLLESMSQAREAVAEGEAMDVAADGEVVQDGEAAEPAAGPNVVAAPTNATALTLDEVRARHRCLEHHSSTPPHHSSLHPSLNLFCSAWQIMDRIEAADQQRERGQGQVDYRQLFGVPDHDDASTAFAKAKKEWGRWKLAGLHPDQRPDVDEAVEARLKDCNEKLDGLLEGASESTFVHLTEPQRKRRIEQWREAQKKEASKKEAEKKSGETPPPPAPTALVRRPSSSKRSPMTSYKTFHIQTASAPQITYVLFPAHRCQSIWLPRWPSACCGCPSTALVRPWRTLGSTSGSIRSAC